MSVTNALTRECLHLLRLRGVLAWRNNTGALTIARTNGRTQFLRFGEVGSGDILAVMPQTGRFLSIEIKTGRDTLRQSQKEWIAQVRAQGGLAIVVRSLGDLCRFLDQQEKFNKVQ